MDTTTRNHRLPPLPAAAVRHGAGAARHLGHRHRPRQRRLQGPPPDGLARARPPRPRHRDRLHRRAGPRPDRASTSASTRAASTRASRKRDEHLRSADFLDVANHPTVTFRSTRVEAPSGAAGDLRVTGDLTIRGVTRPVTLDGGGAAAGDPGPVGQPAPRRQRPRAHQPQGVGPHLEHGDRGGRRRRRRRGRDRDRRGDRRAQGLIRLVGGGTASTNVIEDRRRHARRATCSSTRRTSRWPCRDRSRPAARARTRSADRSWPPPRRRCRSHPRAARSRRRPPRR